MIFFHIGGSLKDNVGVKNPYRYRGYRHDNEKCLCYLNARYYNPEIGRFINSDAYVGTVEELLSCNMFAYCGNNPVNMVDPSGYNGLLLEIAMDFAAPEVILGGLAIYVVGGLVYESYKYYKSTHSAPIHYSDSSSESNVDSSSNNVQSGPYSDLKNPRSVAPGKKFTRTQKKKIIEKNKRRNEGEVKSDDPADMHPNLVKPEKSIRGVKLFFNEWKIDHIIPKSKSGTNGYDNARVISRQFNRLKWDK